jgi:acyl-phosphate glycerol 3-phosphate acyltransferase
MSPDVTFPLLVVVAYLVGSIPFGYLIGRAKGVNLFHVGSGNIGATNAGRVLGRKVGILVFVLDFLKGALPVAAIVPLAKAISPESITAFGGPESWRVSAAVAAFLGHLFPVYLGFRGGKGVATGAGTVLVLMPGPTAVALLTWLAVLLASRFVSVASIFAVLALLVARLLSVKVPFADANLAVTLYGLVGTAIVVVKHRSNIARLKAGTEVPNIKDHRKDGLLRTIHTLALGFWFGAAAFFNFIAAVPIFDSFKEVVANAPSDRTAYIAIVPPGTNELQRSDLASALAGSAVGPLFPRYFALAGLCSWIAFATACGWWKEPGRGNRGRIRLALLAMVLVAVGWPVSLYVSELRVWRFDPDPGAAALAKAAFGPWHFASLLLSAITTALAGILLAMAPGLKDRGATTPPAAAG